MYKSSEIQVLGDVSDHLQQQFAAIKANMNSYTFLGNDMETVGKSILFVINQITTDLNYYIIDKCNQIEENRIDVENRRHISR